LVPLQEAAMRGAGVAALRVEGQGVVWDIEAVL